MLNYNTHDLLAEMVDEFDLEREQAADLLNHLIETDEDDWDWPLD